ncbi:hypothetical protein IWX49DRAFT_27126 [Phyllosticta citricarpa]
MRSIAFTSLPSYSTTTNHQPPTTATSCIHLIIQPVALFLPSPHPLLRPKKKKKFKSNQIKKNQREKAPNTLDACRRPARSHQEPTTGHQRLPTKKRARKLEEQGYIMCIKHAPSVHITSSSNEQRPEAAQSKKNLNPHQIAASQRQQQQHTSNGRVLFV